LEREGGKEDGSKWVIKVDRNQKLWAKKYKVSGQKGREKLKKKAIENDQRIMGNVKQHQGKESIAGHRGACKGKQKHINMKRGKAWKEGTGAAHAGAGE